MTDDLNQEGLEAAAEALRENGYGVDHWEAVEAVDEEREALVENITESEMLDTPALRSARSKLSRGTAGG